MRLTRFTDYSLRVLIYLGQNNEGRVTIHQIAEAYDISKNHLMKVVSNLTHLKFVLAQRGPGGGIQLNHLPKDISIGEVIRNTEKHLRERPAEYAITGVEATADARLGKILQHAMQAYLSELDRFTLANVLESENNIAQLLELNGQAA